MISVEAGQEYKTMSLGLNRIKKFLSDLKVKYDKLKYIHIAGTNGKGSTAKIIADILMKSGYKTGLYTSPHLIKINERIQINSSFIGDKELTILDKKYGALSKKYKLTYFEYITALAFIYFVKNKTDIVVLETGLGGRFDATNIVTPLVSLITSINLDHTEVLGKTLKEIAFEKAGIIKKDVPVICGNIPKSALKEIVNVCKINNSELFCLGKDFTAKSIKYNWKNFTQKIEYKGIKENLKFDLSLLGQSQVYNSATVLCACEILKNKLDKINFKFITNELKNIKWPARFDVKKLTLNDKKCSFVIDGAHNMQAIDNFLDLYKMSPFYGKKSKLCFAVMQEKCYKKVIKKLAPVFKTVNLIKIDNSRAVDTNILKKEFLKYIDCNKIFVYDDICKMFNDMKNNDITICLGSFFSAGNILKYIEELNG